MAESNVVEYGVIVMGLVAMGAVAALVCAVWTLARKLGDLAVQKPHFLVPQTPEGRVEEVVPMNTGGNGVAPDPIEAIAKRVGAAMPPVAPPVGGMGPEESCGERYA